MEIRMDEERFKERNGWREVCGETRQGDGWIERGR
jgi:hypothetical protein